VKKELVLCEVEAQFSYVLFILISRQVYRVQTSVAHESGRGFSPSIRYQNSFLFHCIMMSYLRCKLNIVERQDYLLWAENEGL